MANAILRLPAVKTKTGLSRSSIYLFMARGEFPASIRLSRNCIGWTEASIDAWIAERVERTRTAQQAC